MSKEKVFKVLSDSAAPLKVAQIAEITGLDRAEVDKAIKELKKEEKITSPKMCFYSAVK